MRKARPNAVYRPADSTSMAEIERYGTWNLLPMARRISIRIRMRLPTMKRVRMTFVAIDVDQYASERLMFECCHNVLPGATREFSKKHDNTKDQ